MGFGPVWHGLESTLTSASVVAHIVAPSSTRGGNATEGASLTVAPTGYLRMTFLVCD